MQLLIFGSGGDVFEGRENSKNLHLSPPSFGNRSVMPCARHRR